MSDKAALRAQMKLLREELHARFPDAGEAIAAHFPLKLLERYGPETGAYFPIGSEIDPRPLMTRLEQHGAELSLPRMEDGETLSWRRWRPGEPLEPRRFGLSEPQDSAPLATPTLLIVPLLAFDGAGNRLGYGKGHIDRAIAALRETGRVFVCAIGFQEQMLDALPAEPHDQPLDWAVTPAGSIPLFMMRNMDKLRQG